MTRRTSILATSVVAATLATLAIPASRYAVWNTSASVPTGLYVIRGKQNLHVGERVAILPPPDLGRFLAERGYLPVGVPLLKRVAAVSGQRVCRFAHGVTIDGVLVGVARSFDRRGRPLPAWFGCRQIGSDELFLMNPAAPDSFDGRYFGVLRMSDVIGRATPIWTDEADNGDHIWFADPLTLEISPQQEGPRP
ncbi:MAG: S26 family signal peptidase [Pseudomonadota bacterium]